MTTKQSAPMGDRDEALEEAARCLEGLHIWMGSGDIADFVTKRDGADAIRRLKHFPAPVAAKEVWRPIAEAPKDRPILLSDGTNVWRDTWWSNPQYLCWAWAKEHCLTPTHYMPLPAPPDEVKP